MCLRGPRRTDRTRRPGRGSVDAEVVGAFVGIGRDDDPATGDGISSKLGHAQGYGRSRVQGSGPRAVRASGSRASWLRTSLESYPASKRISRTIEGRGRRRELNRTTSNRQAACTDADAPASRGRRRPDAGAWRASRPRAAGPYRRGSTRLHFDEDQRRRPSRATISISPARVRYRLARIAYPRRAIRRQARFSPILRGAVLRRCDTPSAATLKQRAGLRASGFGLWAQGSGIGLRAESHVPRLETAFTIPPLALIV